MTCEYGSSGRVYAHDACVIPAGTMAAERVAAECRGDWWGATVGHVIGGVCTPHPLDEANWADPVCLGPRKRPGYVTRNPNH